MTENSILDTPFAIVNLPFSGCVRMARDRARIRISNIEAKSRSVRNVAMRAIWHDIGSKYRFFDYVYIINEIYLTLQVK